MTVYKVTKLHGLDILLGVVFIEHFVEQFKGLSCCAPLGLTVHPPGLVAVNPPPCPAFIRGAASGRLMEHNT